MQYSEQFNTHYNTYYTVTKKNTAEEQPLIV